MNIKQEVEAIIFLSGEGVKIKELAKHFSLSFIEMMDFLKELKDDRIDTGLNISFEEEKVFFVTNPLCGEGINRFFEQESKPKKISAAALETVSIIAYKQPITKSEIEAIRGVAVDGIVHTLEERKFIRVCGKKESAGRPNIYEITENFLAYLGIKSVEELPNYSEISRK